MEVFQTVSSLQAVLTNLSGSVGFVPTMGSLHQGHLSLIKKALEENTHLTISIFVNPTQFEDPTDFEKYPRSLEKDLSMIATIAPKALVFTPAVSEIYRNKITAGFYSFNGLDKRMEGNSRQGHFQGVAAVVERLFSIVNPDRAYFGEKDYQQLAIIRHIVVQKKLSLAIVSCPIVRDKSGLALSSRNARLSKHHLEQASLLFRSLKQARALYLDKDASTAQHHVNQLFSQAQEWTLDYFCICDEITLREIDNKKTENVRGFIAAQVGEIRLIDNLSFSLI
ncbi:MAG: Pantothenate synthetase [Flavobacteriaceae bacterium]|nr:MAG: Pantothenate synthetase [Flavobacteriaceae bacterium]|tara:strand:- start:1547 stop:2389 length:843 start_codon:yes stop_codon:yes gene_type:complete